jgi:hypothetical protein
MTHPRHWIVLACAALALAACGAPAETAPTAVAPSATPVSPSATSVPPTETPLADPIVILQDQLAEDGCPRVELDTASWNPMHAAYNTGSDPFYQFHDNEDGFYFNVELYTVYGPGWTGQLGTFDTDCTRNGICVYLVPDDEHAYLATEGEITIEDLSQQSGVLQMPVKLTMRNLTLEPVPGSQSEGCYHVEEVEIEIES